MAYGHGSKLGLSILTLPEWLTRCCRGRMNRSPCDHGYRGKVSEMSVELHVDGNDVRGELWLRLEPGTTVAARERLLDQHLGDILFEASVQMGVVLSSDPHCYAQLTDQVNEEKQTRFWVRGRVEGDRLIPVRSHPRRRQ
ncbi:MAG TPA: hypothetical protein PKL73_20970 [Polyangiaceae bacterium]|nr:MAG: hypothetical protein BWY17_00970 [Deltaproteobacteria bacterium ADurb.Bin207]HNS99444.1 hypothetical protein [Polyangiaceae bacterium]HNZ21372.1 hypothetical protein [Polyangiaceae bacterium]HOD23990.1 hypothetical protein [Polyangiaceae bacterium]HOE47453.1 hypothetical protein [Polyangiaceae bacterium]